MSNEGVYVIGVDGGRESIRVGLFDVDGTLRASCHSTYPTFFPQPGWAEQDPEQRWESLCIATKTLLHETQITPEKIKALGLDATSCTVVFLDHHMKPLRNALLWMDVRANREAEFIAERVPLGSEGIIVLDSFQGNRTPLVDLKLRGAIWSLSLSHRPEHIFRAIMEGVAYGTEFIFQTFRKAHYEVSEIFACGGATRSRLWMQIHSDVSGLPIQIHEVQDAPLLGSAILAAVASELYPSIDSAASRMVRFATRIDPNTENHEAYRFFVDQYIATYGQFSELMHKMTDKMASSRTSSEIGRSG